MVKQLLNKSDTRYQYDILIAGSGFAGSLTALILHQLGLKVCLIEKGKHPRFAIGESSTPIADMILRDLSGKYSLPWLHSFSRYGSWQQSHPEIICGIKRGFSFFKHYPGKEFTTDKNHTNELLVAANDDDMLSDTNWLRADVDGFLVKQVMEAGIDYFDSTEIVSGSRDTSWKFKLNRSNEHLNVQASFFIDAIGSGALLHKLSGIESSSENFQTNSFAVFSHFRNVPYWVDLMQEANISTADFPYNPDLSALHHIMDEGWLWVLRFNDERTSMGFVLQDEKLYSQMSTEQIWNALLKKYPTLNQIFQHIVIADPPGKIIRSGRLQRRISHCSGPGWVALPHTAGFVDPLYSTGIAHSLSGIERIVAIIHHHWDNNISLYEQLREYEQALFKEQTLLDYLIAGSYKTMAHFELFNIWSMLYFAITVNYEQRRLKGELVSNFLHADNPEIMKMVQKLYSELLKILNDQHPSASSIDNFRELIREGIQPINTAGLLDPVCKNMYRHTAAEL